LIRLALIFLFAVGAFVALKLLLARRSLTNRQFMSIYFATLGGLVLLYLGATGRLHWLFALLGAVLPFLVRSIPLIVQVASLRRLFNQIRQATPGMRQQRTSGQKSELNTRFFQMVLDHDSGNMDGKVLEGPHQGKSLSDLELKDLIDLLNLAEQDPDSESVLRAYLDRAHPDWTSQYTGHEQTSGNGPESDSNVSVRQAYEILGLEPDATVKDVRDAHRRLMQKVHPDHGGSTYLAARINEAKSVLLDHLEG
jgi:hypothetical protein